MLLLQVLQFCSFALKLIQNGESAESASRVHACILSEYKKAVAVVVVLCRTKLFWNGRGTTREINAPKRRIRTRARFGFPDQIRSGPPCARDLIPSREERVFSFKCALTRERWSRDWEDRTLDQISLILCAAPWCGQTLIITLMFNHIRALLMLKKVNNDKTGFSARTRRRQMSISRTLLGLKYARVTEEIAK